MPSDNLSPLFIEILQRRANCHDWIEERQHGMKEIGLPIEEIGEARLKITQGCTITVGRLRQEIDLGTSIGSLGLGSEWASAAK